MYGGIHFLKDLTDVVGGGGVLWCCSEVVCVCVVGLRDISRGVGLRDN